MPINSHESADEMLESLDNAEKVGSPHAKQLQELAPIINTVLNGDLAAGASGSLGFLTVVFPFFNPANRSPDGRLPLEMICSGVSKIDLIQVLTELTIGLRSDAEKEYDPEVARAAATAIIEQLQKLEAKAKSEFESVLRQAEGKADDYNEAEK